MNERLRSLFPGTRENAYLNSAAVSLLPLPAIEAVNMQLRDVSMHGAGGYKAWVETKERCRMLLSAMLGVRADQVAFVRNTSDGVSSIANGIEWRPGDNIVSFEGEFPANFYGWRRIRDRYGVELRLCRETAGRVDLDEMLSMIDDATRVVTISAVQYHSGFRADLERLGRAARAVDALFCVDIIQGLGAMRFDLPAQFVDAACGASHKWLCSPEGCGYIYLSDRARERVAPTMVGWISVTTPWDFEDRRQAFKPTVLAWEDGTGPASLFYGLGQSLRILAECGADAIERHLETLTDHICDGIDQSSYEVVSSRLPGERSQIVCIRHRGDLSPEELAARLESENVIVSPRTGRLRIAPHFFNNSADIERLLAALP